MWRSRADALPAPPWRNRRRVRLWRNPPYAAVVVVSALLICPGHAAAQDTSYREHFARALAGLHAALEGSYGDEGAEVVRRLADLEEAVANWDRALRETELRLRARVSGADPDDAAAAHEELASAYFERRRFADAVGELDAARRLAPRRPSLHVLRGLALEAMGNADLAAASFRQAWTFAPDDTASAYLAIARGALDDAERARARETMLRAAQGVLRGVRARPSVPFRQPAPMLGDADAVVFAPARHADGFARFALGEFDASLARLRESVGRDLLVDDPVSRTAHLRQAADSLRMGSLRLALASLDALVAAFPGSSEAHRMLATAAGLAGETRRSVDHFEAALRLRPDDERSWIAFANTYVDAGLLAEGARILEKAVMAVPASGELRWRLAALLVRLEQGGDALAQYAQAERLNPVSGQAAVHQAVATSALLQQDIGRAAEAGARRVRADLDDAAAHRDLASILLKQGRQDEALAEAALAVWLDPNDPLGFVTLGHSLMADRLDEDAVAALERAVFLQPDLREARYALAQALTRVSRHADAQQQLVEFERQRSAAVARERRALELAELKEEAARKSAEGQHAQAVAAWKTVIALEPRSARNYLDLADGLVNAGRPQESVDYLVKAAELDGTAEVHLRLANVLGRLGRSKESARARETYERLRLEDFRRRSSR